MQMKYPSILMILLVLSLLMEQGNANGNSGSQSIDSLGNGTTTNSNDDDNDDASPTETQSAQCTITAGDVQASAQASVSKKLEGVCGTRQMAKSFEILEARLLLEIYQIKSMLMALNPSLADRNRWNHFQVPEYVPTSVYQNLIPKPAALHTNPPQYYSYSTAPPLNASPAQNYQQSSPPSGNPSTEASPTQSSLKNITTTTEKSLEFKPVQLKSLNRVLKPKSSKTGPRDFEVHKFNNTILAGDEIRIFTYYWRMENFTIKLKSNVSQIFSPIISISGLHLRLKATLNHLNRDYIYLQLESVPKEQIDDTSNIVLETGEMFKEIETKKLFKHKIIILDQGTPTSDLISQEFLNTNSGFPVPSSAISSEPFCRDDSILIKIVIFL